MTTVFKDFPINEVSGRFYVDSSVLLFEYFSKKGYSSEKGAKDAITRYVKADDADQLKQLTERNNVLAEQAKAILADMVSMDVVPAPVGTVIEESAVISEAVIDSVSKNVPFKFVNNNVIASVERYSFTSVAYRDARKFMSRPYRFGQVGGTKEKERAIVNIRKNSQILKFIETTRFYIIYFKNWEDKTEYVSMPKHKITVSQLQSLLYRLRNDRIIFNEILHAEQTEHSDQSELLMDPDNNEVVQDIIDADGSSFEFLNDEYECPHCGAAFGECDCYDHESDSGDDAGMLTCEHNDKASY